MALSYQLSGSGTFELSNDFTIKCKVSVIIKYMIVCLSMNMMKEWVGNNFKYILQKFVIP